jgi:two-component system, chemotaxis family, sensor kinase CheA
MGRALAALSAGDEPAAEAVDTLFRMAHSIKGMAASLDYDAAAALAHRLEDWMEPLRAGREVDSAGLSLVAEAIAALEEMVARVDESGEAPAPREDLIARLSAPREPAADLSPSAPLKKKALRPPHRRCPARSAFVRRRSIASWPR